MNPSPASVGDPSFQPLEQIWRYLNYYPGSAPVVQPKQCVRSGCYTQLRERSDHVRILSLG